MENDNGKLESIALLGRIRNPLTAKLEVLELPIPGSEESINVFTSAVLFHLYALRCVGGPKERDLKEHKFQRLISLHYKLVKSGMPLNLLAHTGTYVQPGLKEENLGFCLSCY
jgi:hypothetical protein